MKVRKNVMRRLCIVAWLALPAGAQSQVAQPAAEEAAAVAAQAQRVQAALSALDAEQQALYRQFQMVEALRSALLSELNREAISHQPALTPESYDELVAQRAQRQSRLDGYSEELQRLVERFAEIQAQKAPLIDTLRDLAQAR